MKIALGVSGCIAAYKAAELVRLLQQEGLSVQVVMTKSAQEFVRPLTFAALTGQKVITGMFGGGAEPANVENAVEHIGVADSIDALVVAPATANLLGKLAQGIADDFLTTLYLATKAPVLVAPAMNVNMWQHPAVQANLAQLRERGVAVVEPDQGYLACGWTGPGRLATLEEIVARVLTLLGIRKDLAGETVLVTAGPTCEDIDPVRYITNRSSGRMGYAVAEAARRRGAEVILVSGPTAIPVPSGVRVERVRTAEESRQAVRAALPQTTGGSEGGGVADFRPARTGKHKVKRRRGELKLELEPTADLLEEVAREKGSRLLVGFAAESENVVENARLKLETKHLDLVVANDITREGAGFDGETNIVTLLSRDGRQTDLPKMNKQAVADLILDEVVRLRSRVESGRAQSLPR